MKKGRPGGHFLSETHTLISKLFIFISQQNIYFKQWEIDGGLDSVSALLDYIERRIGKIIETE